MLRQNETILNNTNTMVGVQDHLMTHLKQFVGAATLRRLPQDQWMIVKIRKKIQAESIFSLIQVSLQCKIY